MYTMVVVPCRFPCVEPLYVCQTPRGSNRFMEQFFKIIKEEEKREQRSKLAFVTQKHCTQSYDYWCLNLDGKIVEYAKRNTYDSRTALLGCLLAC